MTQDSNLFNARSPRDGARLILHHPLAWLVSGQEGTFRASLLPISLTGEELHAGSVLMGHLPRTNDQVALLKKDPRAMLLFLGPNGYCSPSWLTNRNWAPTWNFASLQLAVEVEFFEDDRLLHKHLHDLVTAMEAGRPTPWSIAELAERYQDLSERITGFHARVRTIRERFKLGQDESTTVFRELTAALRGDGADTLAQWMDEFNERRSAAQK